MKLISIFLLAIICIQSAYAADDSSQAVSTVVETTQIISNVIETSEAISIAETSQATIVSSLEMINNDCRINEGIMKELNNLMEMMKSAERNNDIEMIDNLRQKIGELKSMVNRDMENCQKSIGQSETIIIETSAPHISICEQILQDISGKKMHYEKLYSLSENDLLSMGYSNGKDDVKRILDEISTHYAQKMRECENEDDFAMDYEQETTEEKIVPEKAMHSSTASIAVSSGFEIADYFKTRATSMMMDEKSIDLKIAGLKEIRAEIDNLIEELIKSKNEISSSELRELVDEIKIKPNQISADNIIINTSSKNVSTSINNNEVKIKLENNNVIISDNKIEVNAPELSIINDSIIVGGLKVNSIASEIIERNGIIHKSVELKEENSNLIYVIKSDNERKILGIIPVMVEKSTTANAGNALGDIIKEEMPWWAFFTTE